MTYLHMMHEFHLIAYNVQYILTFGPMENVMVDYSIHFVHFIITTAELYFQISYSYYFQLFVFFLNPINYQAFIKYQGYS